MAVSTKRPERKISMYIIRYYNIVIKCYQYHIYICIIICVYIYIYICICIYIYIYYIHIISVIIAQPIKYRKQHVGLLVLTPQSWKMQIFKVGQLGMRMFDFFLNEVSIVERHLRLRTNGHLRTSMYWH